MRRQGVNHRELRCWSQEIRGAAEVGMQISCSARRFLAAAQRRKNSVFFFLWASKLFARLSYVRAVIRRSCTCNAVSAFFFVADA